MSDATDFVFDRQRLDELAAQHRADFAAGHPFPHVKIDDFLPADFLEQVVAEFPAPEEAPWQEFDARTEVKLALDDTSEMGPATRRLLAEFNGAAFVAFLQDLTGIDNLIVDHTYTGGGLHQIRPGGFLRVHADFNRHTGLRLDRRLNALLYLNKDWERAYGGHLELWDADMSRPEQKYLPLFNRLVVFATTDDANHGHPDPLTCPPDRARRSIALYYYSNGRPEDEVSDEHTTQFRKRPGEQFASSWKQRAKRWMPPALVDLVRRR